MLITDQVERQFIDAFTKNLRWRDGLRVVMLGGALLALCAFAASRLPGLDQRVWAALAGGGMAAAATALGTAPVFFSRTFSQRTYDAFLGFGAGVMLAASCFSLVVPALAAATDRGATKLGASLMVGGGMAIGVAFILILNRLVQENRSFEALDAAAANAVKRAWIFVLAVTLHNLPEGLAIGIGYAGVALDKANTLATGISIQDIPEGMVVALALRSVGYGRLCSVGLGIVSGLIEPVAAVFGVALIGISASLLPWGLAAAAGAMLFVITNDAVPESHRSGNGKFAMCALILGFILMMVLDTALG
jgi:ZIP family zinc transporter